MGGLQIAFGNYNPYFDVCRPGEIARPDLYKIHSQLQVIDLGSTSVCLGLQALMPAGPDSGGTGIGPTLLAPACSWFQDLGDGTAIQGYVGKSFQANSQWADRLGCGVHFGAAWQCPVPGLCPAPERGVFFVLQAMGYYRYDSAHADSGSAAVAIYPGLHWRLSDSCWVSVAASAGMLLVVCGASEKREPRDSECLIPRLGVYLGLHALRGRWE